MMAWGKRYHNYGRRKFYDNRNRFWAIVCLIASAIVCTLPWLTLELFGETLGGLSIYTIAMNWSSIHLLFVSYQLSGVTDFTMANICVLLTIISLISGLIIVLMWRRLAGVAWLCGLLNIGAAGAWILFMQNLPIYANTQLGGLGIGIGCWSFLVAGGAWIYVGYRVSGGSWF